MDEPRLDDAGDDAPRDASRRDFLAPGRESGPPGVAIGGAAGAAITAAATAHPPEFDPLPKRSTAGFDHVVVVMFENRSFDNMLGWLYTADEKSKADFDGLGAGQLRQSRAGRRGGPGLRLRRPRPTRSCSRRSPTRARPTRT